MTDLTTLIQYLTPLALIAGSIVLGFILEKILLFELKRLTKKTKWRGDEVLVGSLHGIVLYGTILVGVYFSLFYLTINPFVFSTIQKSLLAATILLATVATARIAVGLVHVYVKGILPSTSIFTNITRLIVYALGLLVILQSLGVSITPLLTALGVGGLGVALALQDTLSNLFAGIHIIASKQVRAGDFIRLDTGEKGSVSDINWRNTTINDLPNNNIIVPNAKLASSVITNYYQPEREMSVLVEVGVSYDSDLEKVEQITLDVASEVLNSLSGGVSEFKPFIRYHTFGDSSINFTVILRVKEFADQYVIKHEFIKKLHERYRDEKIEIPFPIRTIMLNKTGGPSDKALN